MNLTYEQFMFAIGRSEREGPELHLGEQGRPFRKLYRILQEEDAKAEALLKESGRPSTPRPTEEVPGTTINSEHLRNASLGISTADQVYQDQLMQVILALITGKMHNHGPDQKIWAQSVVTQARAIIDAVSLESEK